MSLSLGLEGLRNLEADSLGNIGYSVLTSKELLQFKLRLL